VIIRGVEMPEICKKCNSRGGHSLRLADDTEPDVFVSDCVFCRPLPFEDRKQWMSCSCGHPAVWWAEEVTVKGNFSIECNGCGGTIVSCEGVDDEKQNL